MKQAFLVSAAAAVVLVSACSQQPMSRSPAPAAAPSLQTPATLPPGATSPAGNKAATPAPAAMPSTNPATGSTPGMPPGAAGGSANKAETPASAPPPVSR